MERHFQQSKTEENVLEAFNINAKSIFLNSKNPEEIEVTVNNEEQTVTIKVLNV